MRPKARMLGEIARALSLPANTSFVAVNGSIDGGTTTFLGCEGSHPAVAIKVARDIAAGERLALESQMLERLSKLKPSVSSCVPRVRLFRPDLANGALALSIVPGRPMTVQTDRRGQIALDDAARDLRSALGWLLALQRDTMDRDADSCGAARRRLCATAAAFRATFSLTSTEDRVVSSLLDRLDDVLDAGVVSEHGDYCRQNILCRDGGVTGVVDWTTGRAHGLPLNDAFFLCILYFVQARRAPGLTGLVDAFRGCVVDASPAGDVVKALIAEHSDALNVRASTRSDALGWLLLERAVQDAEMFFERRRRCNVPRWMLSLGRETHAGFDDAAGHQFWFAFFRAFVQGTPSLA
jgi:aminoglycoside phosphotransferase